MDDEKPAAFLNIDCSQSLLYSTHEKEKPKEARGLREGRQEDIYLASQPILHWRPVLS